MRRAFPGLACLSLIAACASPDGDGAPAEEQRCPPPAEAPRSIDAVVQALNTMPKPIELPCLLESLPRPLSVHASTSTLSLQPSFDRGSPRIFIFSDPLILSVVPEGDGQPLLEMSELRAEGRSIKAELEFPVLAKLTQAAPFEQVMFTENSTTCGLCHGGETLVESNFALVYESQALRPLPEQRVPLEELRHAAAGCKPTDPWPRCAMLTGLFDHGEVVQREFPESFGFFL